MYNRGYQERLDDDTLVPRRSDFDKLHSAIVARSSSIS
jgi:hypothetical protein